LDVRAGPKDLEGKADTGGAIVAKEMVVVPVYDSYIGVVVIEIFVREDSDILIVWVAFYFIV
jgi:hypothetical protein